jgi:hypothetical protein
MNTNASAVEDSVSIACFLNEIPQSIEDDLARRYETLHSSLPFFRVYRSMKNAGCYVAQCDGHPTQILVFQRNRRRIEVLNEMFHIAAADLKRFVNYIFEHFPDVNVISFKALSTGVEELDFPVQQYNSKDTFVISLPATPEEYIASIGKTTRASIRHQMNTVRKVFPSFASTCLTKDEIDADVIRAIVRLSESRINGKGVKFKHDIDRIISLTKECGFVVLLLIDGRMRAGSINYQVGTGFFGDVTCYDPDYHKYGLGKLCTYQTICESILRGGRHFYLGGGEFDFKERMLGKRVNMDQLQVYRSYAKILANLDWAAFAFAQGLLFRYKKSLQQRKGSLAAKIAFKILQLYRNRVAK